jgi:hypothetical protein
MVAVATSGYLPVLKSAAEGRGYGQGITVATFSGGCTMDTDGVLTCTELGGTGAQTLTVGSGTGAKTVTVGSTTTTSTTTLQSGTGGLVAGDSTNGLRGYVETVAPNGDTTLTSSACGTVQFIGAAGDDFTLPAPAAGCRIRFVTDAAFATTAMTIVTATSANVIYGAVDVNSTLVPCSAEDTITIVESAELPGDFVEVLSDGTNWYVSGVAVTTGAVTCTQAS